MTSALSALLFPPRRVDMSALRQKVEGKSVLITGASYGIGEATALLLATCGAHLILVARSEKKLATVATTVVRLGGAAEIFACDLRVDVEIEGLIDYLLDRPNPIDIFVSNAGKSIRRSLFASLSRYHDVTRTIDLNYLAPVRLTLALTPGLCQTGGQIIQISAANALLAPAPYWAAYQASKVAFDGWLGSAAPELRAAGIACSTIYLPLVRTRMIEPTVAYRNLPAMNPEAAAQLIAHAILHRIRRWRPWWLPWGQWVSLWGRKLWDIVNERRLQKRSTADKNTI